MVAPPTLEVSWFIIEKTNFYLCCTDFDSWMDLKEAVSFSLPGNLRYNDSSNKKNLSSSLYRLRNDLCVEQVEPYSLTHSL